MEKKGIIGKIWGIIYPVLYYFVAQNVIYALGYIITLIIAERYIVTNNIVVSFSDLNSICISSIDTSLVIIFSALVTLPWMMVVYGRDKISENSLPGTVKYVRVPVLKYIYIIPLAVFSLYAGTWTTNILSELLPSWYSAGYSNVAESLFSGSVLFQVLSVVIFGPLVEEFIFRAVIYNRVRRISNKAVGAIVSSLMFGLLHMNLIQGVCAFIVGLVLAFVYDRYKSIAAPILFHMFGNGIAVVAGIVLSDYVDSVPGTTVDMGIYRLVSEISMCVVAYIFTFGFIMLIRQKVVPQPIKQQVAEQQEGVAAK